MVGEGLQNPAVLISARTGLHLKESDSTAVMKAVMTRVRSLELAGPEDYFRLLMAEGPDLRRECRELTAILTTGESYFFRDPGQFSLLKNRILPELLSLHGHDRTLRIWSAGCARGEEAYSLAIVLRGLIHDPERWNLRILGTDIQETFLETARAGIFGHWSFRGVPAALKERWFTRTDRGYRLDPRILKMVSFRSLDLLWDTFPEGGQDLDSTDLILCRNLFIYFNRNAVAVIAEKLARCLSPGGYLLTGHGELFSSVPKILKSRSFPESVIFQREEGRSFPPEETPLAVSDRTVSPPWSRVRKEKRRSSGTGREGRPRFSSRRLMRRGTASIRDSFPPISNGPPCTRKKTILPGPAGSAGPCWTACELFRRRSGSNPIRRRPWGK